VQAASGEANTGWTFTLPASVNRNQTHTVRAFVGTRELAASGKSFGTNPGGGTPNFIDGVFDNSSVVKQAVGDKLPGARSPEATLSAVLGNLMIKADDSTKTKLAGLLEQARQLGVQDKVS
jgi:hypothetical protein